MKRFNEIKNRNELADFLRVTRGYLSYVLLITNVKEKFNDVYIDKQLNIMMALVNESPSDVIGKSKEILESCFKHILDEFGEEYSSSASIAQLRKQVFVKLNLDPKENISAKNNNDVRKILSSFIQVVDGLNSLRNDKGDGHGKGQNYKSYLYDMQN